MLTITEDALEAIRLLVRETGAEGVRISASPHAMNGSGPALKLEPAVGPERGDETLDTEGAHVYLATSTAALGEKVLDAEFEAGEVRFELHERD